MEYVNYIALACSFAALALSVIAGARVGKFMRSTADTDWETLANLTGDIAALKRTAQTPVSYTHLTLPTIYSV